MNVPPASRSSSSSLSREERWESRKNDFVLNARLSSVVDIYREWKAGIGGLPSLEWMESEFSQWRRGKNTLAQAVSRRKVIVSAIRKRVFCKEGNATDDECCQILDAKRIEMKFSLDKFVKWLKSENLV